MTNEEIKKALECCNSTGPHFCDDCPYCCVGRCRDELITSALNIITEQEKEIEKQGQKIEDLNGLIDYADKEIRKLRAENEKLKAELGEID